MTVTEKSSRKIISGAGWVNPLTHDYMVEDASYVHVFADTVELVQGVDYTVTNVNNPAGYAVTIAVPGSWAPTEWVLDARPPIAQGKDLTLGGQFGAKYEDGLDQLARRVQRVYDLARRGLKSALSATVGDSPYTLPEAEAGNVIGWNAAGTDLENKSLAATGVAIISSLWLTALALLTYAEAWMVLKLNGSLSTRALIKALVPQDGMSVLLTESGRVGNFVWRLGDYSAQVALDTQEGVYLKADSVAATVGAWVRDFSILNVEMFGASALASRSSNRAAIQCAVNVAQAYVGSLLIRDTYLTDGAIVQTAAMQLWGHHADKSKVSSNSGPALSLVPSAGIATDNTWWGWKNFSALSTDAGARYGIEYVSSGNEYMSNWIMEGVKASGTAGGVSFDSTGSTVGIFSCTMRRNWWDNGSVFKDIGDSVHILENTINGNGIGVLINGVKGGAQQLVIADNNITTRAECVYLLNVSAAHIDRNWMETPSYLGSYTGTTGALLYAQGCPNTRIERNTIQPLNAAMIGLGQTAAAYSIRLNTSGDASIIEGNRLIAIGNTGHIQIGGGVTNTYIKEDNKFDATPVITDAGTGTFGAGNTPGVFNQVVKFTTTAQFTSVDIAESTNAGTGNGPYREIYRNKAGGAAANDGIGGFLWYMNNSVGAKTNLGYITMTVLDPVAGTEDGQFNIARMLGGALVVGFTYGATFNFTTGGTFTGTISPAANDGGALGNTTNQWSDLFLASGGVINFNNGNYSITHTAGVLTFNGSVVLSSAGGSIGYVAGAGGAVTQATDKSTGVTLNRPTGAITMNAASLAAGAIVSFTLTNSAITADDVLILNHKAVGTPGGYALNARCAAGSATIDVRNNTAGALAEAIVIQFALVQGAIT